MVQNSILRARMSGVPVILLFAWCVMFAGEIQPSSALDKCIANSNCRNLLGRKICCAKSSSVQNGCVGSSCVGERCITDGDCGGKDECCKHKRCTIVGCNACYSNSNCGSYLHKLYCCKHPYTSHDNVCRHSCIGEACYSDSDCGRPGEFCTSSKICWQSGLDCTENTHCKGDGECCEAGKCVNQCSRSCSSRDDCKLGECCKYRVCSTSCDGDHCLSNSDCGGSSNCCKRGNLTNVCLESCVGENCLSDDHCGHSDEYCNMNTTKCDKKDNSLAGWAIAVIVVSVLAFVFICGGCWACYHCCGESSSQRGRVIRAPQRTTAIIALRETEIRTISPAPAHNYPPPAYYNQGQDRSAPYAMPSLPPQQGYPTQQTYPPEQGYPPQQPYPPQPLHFPSP